MVTLGYPSLHGDSHIPGWSQVPLLLSCARFLPGKNMPILLGWFLNQKINNSKELPEVSEIEQNH